MCAPKSYRFLTIIILKGEGLLDNILVANEVVEELSRKKKSKVIIKVDYERAYDFMSWDFLYYIMGRLGFYRQWIG